LQRCTNTYFHPEKTLPDDEDDDRGDPP